MSEVLTRLIANARNHLPGALDETIKYELFNTLNEFFRAANIWQEDITFRVKPSSQTYYIEQEVGSTILRLVAVKSSDDIIVNATMATPGEIDLVQAPSDTDTYTATVILSVSDPIKADGFPQFPSWIMDKYSIDFIDGIVGRMMAQPAKPYTNLPLAAIYQRKFRTAISQAKTDALHKNMQNGQTWRFPRFVISRRR